MDAMMTTEPFRPPNLRVWLALHEKTQTEFAAELGLRQNVLSMYLNGQRRMPLTLAVRIAERTGIPIESLIHPRYRVQ